MDNIPSPPNSLQRDTSAKMSENAAHTKLTLDSRRYMAGNEKASDGRDTYQRLHYRTYGAKFRTLELRPILTRV